MFERRSVTAVALVAATAVAIGTLSGCAAMRGAKVDAGANLEYRMAKAVPVTYSNSQIASQAMEMMGQTMNVETVRSMVFTLVPGKADKGKQALTVKIDSLEARMTTPQGAFTADTAPAVGKTFEMALTAAGKETDIVGADLIQYNLGTAGQRSVKPDFQAIFPDLAGRPLQVGDIWTAADTVKTEDGGMAVTVMTQYVHTLAGFEEIGGMRCGRITTLTTGTVTGAGTQQGAQVALEAATEGADTWFFAADLGLLVKLTSETRITGTVTVGGQGGMKIPTKQQMTTEMALVR
ncbi:MAG: hypothetical protein WAW06_05985 [bacterium]